MRDNGRACGPCTLEGAGTAVPLRPHHTAFAGGAEALVVEGFYLVGPGGIAFRSVRASARTLQSFSKAASTPTSSRERIFRIVRTANNRAHAAGHGSRAHRGG